MYKITQRCIELVEEIFKEGYGGTAEITRSYCSGTQDVLGEAFSIQLSGFCKETLHIVEDTDTEDLIFVGRYAVERVEPTVEGVVEAAWSFYKSYKGSGYRIPSEFEGLFKKYGYIV